MPTADPTDLVTDTDRREFKRTGFQARPALLDPMLMAKAREVVNNDDVPQTAEELQAMMDADDEDLDLDVDGRGVKMFGGADGGVCIASSVDEEPFRTINETVFQYAEQFVGEGQLEPPTASTRITMRFPNHQELTDPDAQQPSDLGTHIDGINTSSERLVTIGVGIFIDRVQPRGGGTTVWPGSHRIAGKYFETLDREEYGEAGGGLPGWTGDGFDHDRNFRDQYDPVEVHGPAGSALFWHGHIEHSGGVNILPGPRRVALFTRFRLREDLYDIERIAPNPFYGWTAMEDIDIDGPW